MFKCDRFAPLSLVLGCICGLAIINPLQAQIIPDASLGSESSVVTPNVTIKDSSADLIEGGAVRDSNLFHSFSEFNVSNNNAVYFASPDGINNILTRVTGSNVSNIFGTLGTDGAANLFLLNPNGIVFGQNAALDINGSFFATTAESYIFGKDAIKFGASDPTTAPLLNINLTPGLQMGNNSGKIIVRGDGHSLTGGIFFPLNSNNTASTLKLTPGKTLGLIANGINLDGGVIKIPGSNIQLNSINNGKVSLEQNLERWQLNNSPGSKLGDIRLYNKAIVDTSGVVTGDIKLQGKNIALEDASAITIQNFGSQTSGNITIDATDSITLSGSLTLPAV